MESYFIKWIAVNSYHYLFGCLNHSRSGQWELLKIGSCVLLTYPRHSLRPSWFSDMVKYSHLISDFSRPSLGLKRLSKELCFLLAKSGIRSSLLPGCHCPQVLSVARAWTWINKQWLNERMDIPSYSHMYFHIYHFEKDTLTSNPKTLGCPFHSSRISLYLSSWLWESRLLSLVCLHNCSPTGM